MGKSDILGLIIVDHGSRRDESNRMLEEVAAQFARKYGAKFAIVEPAHMEIAEPSIATAFAKCVSRGATRVVICPFFLGPGKHWTQDIPALTAAAAGKYPAVGFHVAPTLGIDDLILQLLEKRAAHCVESQFSCDICAGTACFGRDPK